MYFAFFHTPRSRTAVNILRICNDFKMIWINAGWISAEMIETKTLRDRAMLKHKHDSMDILHFAYSPIRKPSKPISSLVVSTSPKPASRIRLRMNSQINSIDVSLQHQIPHSLRSPSSAAFIRSVAATIADDLECQPSQ